MPRKKSVQQKRTPAQRRKAARQRVARLIKSEDRRLDAPKGVNTPGDAVTRKGTAEREQKKRKKRQRQRNA